MKQAAKRIREIPPYLFAGIERKIEEYKEKGIDIISFGIGDPDLPTPDFIIEKMAEESLDKGFFSDSTIKKYPNLSERLKVYEKIGKETALGVRR